MPDNVFRGGPAAGLASVCAVALAAAVLCPRALEAQGLTLRLAPEAHAFRWDEALALNDATFLGGGLSIGFGRYVTLRGAYGAGGTVETAFARAGFLADDGTAPNENDVQVSLFSANVLFRLGDRRIAPVLSR